MGNLENLTYIYVLFEYKISCLDGGHFVNFSLFWPKYCHKVQNGLDQKGDVLEKKVIRYFFLKLDAESTKSINFEIHDPG
jgi:hypothetical protein